MTHMTPERRAQLLGASRLGRLALTGRELPPDAAPPAEFYSPDQPRAKGRFAPKGGSDESGPAVAPSADGKHGVKLPANSKKLNLGPTVQALAEMGHKLGDSKYDFATKETHYHLTGPDGKSRWASSKEVGDMVYAGRRVAAPAPKATVGELKKRLADAEAKVAASVAKASDAKSKAPKKKAPKEKAAPAPAPALPRAVYGQVPPDLAAHIHTVARELWEKGAAEKGPLHTGMVSVPAMREEIRRRFGDAAAGPAFDDAAFYELRNKDHGRMDGPSWGAHHTPEEYAGGLKRLDNNFQWYWPTPPAVRDGSDPLPRFGPGPEHKTLPPLPPVAPPAAPPAPKSEPGGAARAPKSPAPPKPKAPKAKAPKAVKTAPDHPATVSRIRDTIARAVADIQKGNGRTGMHAGPGRYDEAAVHKVFDDARAAVTAKKDVADLVIHLRRANGDEKMERYYRRQPLKELDRLYTESTRGRLGSAGRAMM